MELREFPFGNSKPLAKKSEEMCYRIVALIGILIFISYMMFHPLIGNYNNLPTVFIMEHVGSFRYIIYIITFIELIFTTCAQLIFIYGSFYIVWVAHIHYFRLKEYIDTNLHKKYESFEIIQSLYEQDQIYVHLKKCTEFHLLLTR